MRRATLTIIAIAIVAILVIAAVALYSLNTNNKASLSTANGTSLTNTVNDSTKNVTAKSPTAVLAGDEHFSLSASYPGSGNSSYSYETDKEYDLTIIATANGSWSGRVAVLVFIEKAGEYIGSDCVILQNGGTDVVWNITGLNEWNLAYAHVFVWTTNGSSQYSDQLSFQFNSTEVGGYNMTVPSVRCQHWCGHFATTDPRSDAGSCDQGDDDSEGRQWGHTDDERHVLFPDRPGHNKRLEHRTHRQHTEPYVVGQFYCSDSCQQSDQVHLAGLGTWTADPVPGVLPDIGGEPNARTYLQR